MSDQLKPIGVGAARARRARLVLSAAVAPLAIVAIAAPVVAQAQVAEITVTARKREENVQNIPVAVTAVSGDQIQRFNMQQVTDVETATPQLMIAPNGSGSGASINLRGIGASAGNIGIEQSVSVNIDGVYYGQGRAIDEGLFDTAGVQVLEGPQALFYGKNATAGALAIQTNDPTFTHDGYVTAGYEAAAQQPYVEGVVNEALNDQFAMRFSFRYSHMFSGLFQNQSYAGFYPTIDVGVTLPNGSHPTYNNQSPTPPPYLGGDQNIVLRLGAKWAPTNNFTVVAKVTFDRLNTNNNNGGNSVLYKCVLGYPQSEAALMRRDTCGERFSGAQPAIPIVIAAIPGLESAGGGQNFNHYQDATYYLRFEYNIPNASFISTNSYQDLFNEWGGNNNGNSAESVFAGEYYNWEQVSTEDRVTTAFKFPINFSGGFYFQKTRLHFLQDVDFARAMDTAAPTPQDTYVAYNKLSATDGRTISVFGQGIWDPIKNVEITGGARFTDETKDSFFLQPWVNPTLRTLFIMYSPGNPASEVGPDHQHWTNISPEATITWKPTPNLTVYAAYKTGYKSGGFSDSAILSVLTDPIDLTFKPETVSGYEGGIKSILMDDQLRVNFTAYDYQYSNLQVDFFNTPSFNYITLNAASARTYGAELAIDYAPRSIQGLNLHADITYNHAQYGRFIAPCYPADLTYEQGCSLFRVVTDFATGAYVFSPNCGGSPKGVTPVIPNCTFMDVSGGPVPRAPRWAAVLSGDYRHPLVGRWIGGIGFNARFASSYFAAGFPSGLARSIATWPGYAALDMTASLETDDHRWMIQVIARNLTNAWIPLAIGPTALAGANGATGCKVSVCGAQDQFDLNANVQNPRTVALQVTYHY